MLNSPDTVRGLLTGFPSIAWSMASESILLGLFNFAWLSRFLLRLHLLHNKFFIVFVALWLLFELGKHKFQNWAMFMLHIHLCCFQITHRVKQCTKCQRTCYHANIYNGSNCLGNMIYALKTCTYQNIAILIVIKTEYWILPPLPIEFVRAEQTSLISAC